MLRGKPVEEVEERNEDGGCHEDQEFLFVIIIPIGSWLLLVVNHANDVKWILRKVLILNWRSVQKFVGKKRLILKRKHC